MIPDYDYFTLKLYKSGTTLSGDFAAMVENRLPQSHNLDSEDIDQNILSSRMMTSLA